MKLNEKMIIRDGKLVYAVSLGGKVGGSSLLLEVKNEVAAVTKAVENAATKEDVEAVIVDSVAPVVLTKSARKHNGA